jgi:ubiquinone/menaquinone biosynthesis C-methylase UbiE
MGTDQEIKDMVRQKYGAIAEQSKEQNASSCCGSTCGCSSDNVEFSVMAEDYSKLPGYAPEADLALGCGLPTEFARIRKGDTVVDLGSGAGNDCFIARSVTGAEGRVIGIDMTDAMLSRARANAAKLGYTNVEFRHGDIEQMPVEDDTADVVVSNCVMNLVPDKVKAFAETFRILKPGGHFSISDIVLKGELPATVRDQAALYAGCIAGAMQMGDYLAVIRGAGFANLTIQKERKIDVPEDLLNKYLTPEQMAEFRRNQTGIFSITVFAEKPVR